MKKTNRILSLLLIIVMVVCMLPIPAFAAVSPITNLCEHHTSHDTAVCGYAEGRPAVACTHGEHTDDCYEVKCSHVCDESCIQYSPCTFVCTGAEDCLTSTPTGEHDASCYTSQCTHVCGEDCADPCAFVCTGEGDCTTQVLNCQNTEVCYTTACNHVHDDTCREKLPCAFICTNEENCLAKTLICGHVEDGSCCAKTEVTAQPCTFVCETCANTPAPVAETYTITYDANGGTGTVTDSNAYAADENATVLAADGLTAPAGKEFDSWNTNADGTGIPHAPDSSITVSENITLYAQWVDKCTCNVHCTDALILETSCAFCRASGNPDDCKGTDTLEGGDFTYNGITYHITDKYNHDVSVTGGGGVSGNVEIPRLAYNGDVSYTVTKIDDTAFQGHSSLTGITIPDSVTKIGYVAFGSCSALTSVTIPSSVTVIDALAFESCTALTSITIPDSVGEIGKGAFWDCTTLESVNLPYGLTTIGESTFRGCVGLKTVTIPSSVKTIEAMAFRGCSQLTNITIPQGVTTIPDQAFADCESLTSITIPNSVTEIGAGAFLRCKKLSSVVLPSGLTSIPESTFGNCEALSSIEIPDSITSIGNYAFQNTALTSITIPASVTTIGKRAFRFCSSLQTVLLMTDSPKAIDATAFEDTSATITHKYVAPSNLRFDGTTLRWDALKTGYVRYKLVVSQTESPTGIVSKSETYYATGGSCDLSGYLSSGTYEIRLTAVEPEILDNSQPSYESSDTVIIKTKYPVQVEISDIQATRVDRYTGKVSFTTSMAGTMYYTLSELAYNQTPSINTDGEGTPVPKGYYEFTLPLVGAANPGWGQHLYVTFKTAEGTVSDVQHIEIPSMEYYTVNATAGDGGSISPATEYVKEGDSLTLTITPNEGYELAALTVDGVDVTDDVASNQYTVSGIEKDKTVAVAATFKPVSCTCNTKCTDAANADCPVCSGDGAVLAEVCKGQIKTYSVSISKDGGGTVTGEGSYAPGEQVTITATPDTASGYCAAGWGLGAVGDHVVPPVDLKTSHTFTMPEKNVAISITFVQHSYTAYSNLGNGTHQNCCLYCSTPNGAAEAHVDKIGAGNSQKPNGICDKCDADMPTDPGPHTHSYDTLKYDADNHWYECSCGTKSGEAAHSGGTATCTEKAKCKVCNTEYGNALGHGDTEVKDAKQATCTAEGFTGDTYCKTCGEKLETGTTIAKTAHTYKHGKCTVCEKADSNYDPDTPQTGDNSHAGLWLLMMLVGGLGFAVTTICGKKRKVN